MNSFRSAHLVAPTLCLLALLFTGAAFAEDIVTTDGRTFTNIRVSSETPESVKIVHDGGIALLPKKVLTADFLTAHELTAPPMNRRRLPWPPSRPASPPSRPGMAAPSCPRT